MRFPEWLRADSLFASKSIGKAKDVKNVKTLNFDGSRIEKNAVHSAKFARMMGLN